MKIYVKYDHETSLVEVNILLYTIGSPLPGAEFYCMDSRASNAE